jgi:hypothetical protein
MHLPFIHYLASPVIVINAPDKELPLCRDVNLFVVPDSCLRSRQNYAASRDRFHKMQTITIDGNSFTLWNSDTFEHAFDRQ